MNTQQTYKLTLRPFIWTGNGAVLNYDAPAAAHFVDGMPNNEIVQVINKRAHGREPLWHIRYVTLDAEVGEYKTAEDALTTLEEFVDEPTVLLDALHRAETEWAAKYGHIPNHQFAKFAHRDVEAWGRIVKAHGLL